MALLSKNKLGFIDGTIVKPANIDPTFHAWERCNTIVLSWIHRSINNSIAKSILWINQACEAWADLKARFSHSDIFRISDIQEQVYHMQQGQFSVTDYFTNMKIMWDELDNLKPLPTCSCALRCSCNGYPLMREYRDCDRSVRFLKGLNDQYGHIQCESNPNQLGNDPRIFHSSTDNTRFHSSTDNPRFHSSTDNPRFHNYTDNTHRGVYGRGRGRASTNIFGRGRGNNTKLCTHCGRTNHTVDTCYKKHGFPPNFQSRNAANFSSQDDSNEAMQSQEVQEANVTISQEEYESLLNAFNHQNSIMPETPISSTNMIQTTALNADST
ncbi:uncharacterized protein LOC133298081, partial [Gastrolobium bilobum]|uniref:uncharacterized protein LOC133298081 n=1 Tax=Gastrolobium bilobum TaxID=150636 RepID=UPI002AAFAFA8